MYKQDSHVHMMFLLVCAWVAWYGTDIHRSRSRMRLRCTS